MILLKISNASELIASKLNPLLERITPDSLDESAVDEIVASKMIENFQEEGLKGEISIVRSLSFDKENISIEKGFKVKKYYSF
tara:strand:+ start:1621 stop:1869 length:249 start_codon:yes stop_codon:yes gene_type:complete